MSNKKRQLITKLANTSWQDSFLTKNDYRVVGLSHGKGGTSRKGQPQTNILGWAYYMSKMAHASAYSARNLCADGVQARSRAPGALQMLCGAVECWPFGFG